MKTETTVRDRMLVEGARRACLKAAAEAYEDAGIRGLCDEGRWECAVAAIRAADLEATRDMRIEPGGRVPDFVVRDMGGAPISYAGIWQQRNLLLVALAGAGAEEETTWAAALRAHGEAIQECEATLVITREPVPGLPPPAVLVADRWGEVTAAAYADHPADLPPADQVVEWLRFVAHACPECEGEAR